MKKFIRTRSALFEVSFFISTVNPLLKDHFRNENSNLPVKEEDNYKTILQYLIDYSILVFRAEAEGYAIELMEYYTKIEKKSQEKINTKVEEVLKRNDTLITTYNNFVMTRNQNIAHVGRGSFFTWEGITRIELETHQGETFDIADIGEKMVVLMRDELDKI